MAGKGGGSTKERGLGGEHERMRAQWAPIVEAGGGWCSEPICLEESRWIAPGSVWHLSHSVDRQRYLGPSHQRCNLAEGGRRSRGPRSTWRQQVQLAQQSTEQLRTSREW